MCRVEQRMGLAEVDRFFIVTCLTCVLLENSHPCILALSHLYFHYKALHKTYWEKNRKCHIWALRLGH